MKHYRPGDTVPKTGFYRCLRCKRTTLRLKGRHFPRCPGGCKAPVYVFAHQELRQKGNRNAQLN